MNELVVYNLWAAAWLVCQGCKVARYIPVSKWRIGVGFEDNDGKASRALDVWRTGTPLVHGRLLVDNHSELLAAARAVETRR
jgi:hypothetical protein